MHVLLSDISDNYIDRAAPTQIFYTFDLFVSYLESFLPPVVTVNYTAFLL